MNALLLAAWLAAAASAQLSRGPYIVAGSSTSAQICWRYQASDDCHLFDSLAPGATFSYTFGGLSTEAWTGQTLPASTQTLRFTAFGDLGADAGVAVRLAALIDASGAQLAVVLGDIAYPAGEDEAYDAQYFRPFAGPLSRIPFYTVVGDADYGDFSTAKKGRKRFDEVYGRIQHKPPFYSFDAGPVHFVALDTDSAYYIPGAALLDPGSEQRRWLEDDLARAQAPWKIALVHVPLHSTMRYNGQNGYLKHLLEPILAKNRVDLVLQSHDRVYERSKPVSGIVYVTAGTGGAKLDAKQELDADWLQVRVSSFGLVEAQVDPASLRVQFVDVSGVVRDSFELKKPSAP